MTSPIARVAAYTAAAQRHGVTTIDADMDGGGARVDLTVADLAAVLAALADACDDHETCETCGAPLCVTCGVGEAADCPADRIHCTSGWCFDQACIAAGVA